VTEPDLDQRALMGLFLLAAGGSLAPVALHVARRVTPGRRVFFARWGFSHFAIVVAVGIAAAFLGARVLGHGIDPLQDLYANLLALSAAAGAAVFAARTCEPDGWRALGLRGGGNPRALACGALSFVFLFPALCGAYAAWPWVHGLFDGDPWMEQVVVREIAALRGFDLVQACVIAVVVQPFVEELLFRGFLQPLLVQNLSDRLGIVVTSALFALLHGTSAFLPIFVLSLVIGAVMLRTQRLSAAWLVHAMNNALVLVVALTSSDVPLSGS
jgi:membrane protease YdiL (CAAX protease family)